jgi:predicted nucleic acid-binding protein
MKKQEAFFILIATFILILAWIVFSILDSAVSSTISQSLHFQIAPISPTFDTKVVDELKKRQQVVSLNAEAVAPASTSAKPVSFVIQDSSVIKKATSSGIIEQIIRP